jgi:hypothetical protein
MASITPKLLLTLVLYIVDMSIYVLDDAAECKRACLNILYIPSLLRSLPVILCSKRQTVGRYVVYVVFPFPIEESDYGYNC